jgi:hypothetical protein
VSTVNDRSQPIRSAITVAGICGNSFNRPRICGSTESTIEPVPARTYRGGCVERTAPRTVFRARCNFRAIALIDIPSARCNRRISAHSSTKITSQIVDGRGSIFTRPERVSFQASSTGPDGPCPLTCVSSPATNWSTSSAALNSADSPATSRAFAREAKRASPCFLTGTSVPRRLRGDA